jgi:hypothetical protein
MLYAAPMSRSRPQGARHHAEQERSAERGTYVDQLISQISQQTGISTAQAQQAVQMVVGFLKNQLPAPVASQLEGVLRGQGTGNMPGQGQQMMGNLGDMYGQTNP